MSWALFWFVAFCFVATFALLDNLEWIQVWARRQLSEIFGRLAAVTGSGVRARGNDRLSHSADKNGASRGKVTVSAAAQTKAAPIMSHRTDLKPDKARIMGQLQWGQWLSGVASFIWRWKVPLLAMAAFVAIAVTISGCMPGWGKSKDTLRAERDAALVDKIVTEHERSVANRATELAEETHADTARVLDVVARAEEELADAVELADFDALWSAYDRAYRGVWALDPGEDFPNPPPGRPDSLRGAGADLA